MTYADEIYTKPPGYSIEDFNRFCSWQGRYGLAEPHTEAQIIEQQELRNHTPGRTRT